MLNGKTLRRAAGIVGLAVAFWAGAANADPIVVKHAQGETTLEKIPAKVLTFDLAALDTLDALGIEVAGVPTGNKPDYLSKYRSDDYAKIGTFFEPDYEAVNAAEADLIIVAGRSSPKYADLAKIAPTIDLTVDADDYLSSAANNVLTLGRIFGKEAEAKALLDKLQSSTAALKATAEKSGKGLLVLTTGGKMSAYGPGSRFGVLYSDYGVAPAAENLKVGNHGQAISFEFILETNPDWLYVIDRDAAIGREGAAREFLDNEIVHQTNAWKNGNVVYLDPVSWYLVGGGIRSMQQTVDQLQSALDKT
ncbi:MAG: siderophore ABC transporter substrate-binding protein [Shinella sp.]|nr:siderophore ABC transporter substrate-binding protein [Shinella sp.]